MKVGDKVRVGDVHTIDKIEGSFIRVKENNYIYHIEDFELVRNSLDEMTPEEKEKTISDYPEQLSPNDGDIMLHRTFPTGSVRDNDDKHSGMTQKQYELSVDNLLDMASDIAGNKRKNYADDHDVTLNFKRAATQLGIDPKQALAVHLEKQMSAIYSYINTGYESEPIETRLCDAINYIFLLNSLIIQSK